MKNFESKSISELEGWTWKDKIPARGLDSGVVCRFYELHNVPLSRLELHDTRFLIGQNAALEYLVPKALKALRENLFIETEYYPGDLFCALLKINNEPNYWQSHKKEKQVLIDLYNSQIEKLGELDESEEIKKSVKRAYKEFMGV